ncbi:MAG: LLM class flavin-dependent oxidoreductase [Geminicoccaceae bacterium]
MHPTIDLFTTCPPSAGPTPGDTASGPAYREQVKAIARWSEAVGCKGILVYTDNRLVDPWLISHLIIQTTETLAPLVAVQPVYMHPYTAAKMAATFAHLYGRKIYLNMVAGGFVRDLEALNDFTPHDPRYDRLVEYSKIVKELAVNASAGRGMSYDEIYYKVNNLKLTPPLPPELVPTLFVSGSSEAGLAAAEALGAVAVQYPQPQSAYPPIAGEPTGKMGIRIGVIARDDPEEAWRIAEERFPPDRRGEIAHQMAMKTSDSSWHKSLSEWPELDADADTPYWLRPFQSYKTFCPYLVGSYDRVATEIAAYIRAGFTTYILDIPPSEDELHTIRKAFDIAEASFR